MLEKIQAIIFEVTGKKGVTYETDLVQDLGLNSFDVMNIIGMAEEMFDISIPTRDVWKMRTIHDVLEYLSSKGIS